MIQYIDKAAVVAEIERIYHETNYEPFTDEVLGKRNVCGKMRDFLGTLEVKKVDLEKEVEKYLLTNAVFLIGGDSKLVVHHIAKHFFDLGLKAKKE